jgi:oxygen-independent coproporphyrinogen-3 oxidase
MAESFFATGRFPVGNRFSPRPVDALYIHIPFCATRCHYCAFHSSDSWTADEQEEVVTTILADLHEVAGSVASARTVYIGGGTPTVLAPRQLERLLTAVRSVVPGLSECTVEANPDSCSADHLTVLEETQVNRLSLGVQSLSPTVTKVLGRAASDIRRLSGLRSAWGGSLSADLMFGVTRRMLRQTSSDVRRLDTVGFDHLSIYELSVEEGTVLSRRNHPSADSYPEREDAWAELLGATAAAGFARYEVSSFARAGQECLHNLAYWRGCDYIGLGPSAVSTFRSGGETVRLTQQRETGSYCAKRSFSEADAERLAPVDRAVERLMLGLRTTEGVDRKRFTDDFGVDPVRLDPPAFSRARKERLLRVGEHRIVPTDGGLDLLNLLLRRLIADSENWPIRPES